MAQIEGEANNYSTSFNIAAYRLDYNTTQAQYNNTKYIQLYIIQRKIINSFIPTSATLKQYARKLR